MRSGQLVFFYILLRIVVRVLLMLWRHFGWDSQKGRKVNVETKSRIYEAEAQLTEKREIVIEERYWLDIVDYQLTFKILNDALAQPQLIDNAIHDTFRAGEEVQLSVNESYYSRFAEKGVGLLKFRRIAIGGRNDFELVSFETRAENK